MNTGIEEPLLLRACMGGRFGHVYEYDGGAVCEAGFIYLLGRPHMELLNAHLDENWRGRMFICRSAEWRRALTLSWPELNCVTRWQMAAAPQDFDIQKLQAMAANVPQDYRIRPFSAAAFELHPFGHGFNYDTYDTFARTGSGAVAYCGDEIVTSASSFLSYDGAVELDISTLPAHRRKGLAAACCAAMLLDCLARGIDVHWDAQNTASRALACRLGYHTLYDYAAHTFVDPKRFSV